MHIWAIHITTSGGQPISKSLFYPSHTSLVLRHWSQRNGRLGYAGWEVRLRNTAWGAREIWRLCLLHYRLSIMPHTLPQCIGFEEPLSGI